MRYFFVKILTMERLHLNKYLKPGKNKKLKKIVDNMANKNVKGVVNAWK